MYILQGFEINEKVTSKCMFNFFKTIIYVIFQPKKRKKKKKKRKRKVFTTFNRDNKHTQR